MKWFKHLSHSLDDQFICELMDEFGSDGYVVFFGVLEILASEFDVKLPGEVTLKWSYLRRKVRLSTQKLKKILNFCEKNHVFLVNNNHPEGRKVTIKSVRFSEVCDEYTQRLYKVESKKAVGILSGQYRDSIGSLSVPIKKQKEKKKENNNKAAEAIEKVSKEISKKLSKALFNPYKFANANKKVHPGAMLHTLNRILKEGEKLKEPWAYAVKILAVEHQNYNERDTMQQAEKYKKELSLFAKELERKSKT